MLLPRQLCEPELCLYVGVSSSVQPVSRKTTESDLLEAISTHRHADTQTRTHRALICGSDSIITGKLKG